MSTCPDCHGDLTQHGYHYDREAEVNCSALVRAERDRWRAVAVKAEGDRAFMSGRLTVLQERCTELTLELRSVDRRRQVREFFMVCLQERMPDRPGAGDSEVVRSKLRLVGEEFGELLDGVLGKWSTEPWRFTRLREELTFCIDHLPVEVDLLETADAIVDLGYVLEGLAIVLGVDTNAVWREVQRANMAKADGPRRPSDNKLLKPPGWRPPDIAGVLRAQGWVDPTKDPA